MNYSTLYKSHILELLQLSQQVVVSRITAGVDRARHRLRNQHKKAPKAGREPPPCYCLLLTAYYVLLTAYYLLRTAYYVLRTTYSLPYLIRIGESLLRVIGQFLHSVYPSWMRYGISNMLSNTGDKVQGYEHLRSVYPV